MVDEAGEHRLDRQDRQDMWYRQDRRDRQGRAMVAGSTMLSLIQTHLTPELEQLGQDTDSGVDPGGGQRLCPPLTQYLLYIS